MLIMRNEKIFITGGTGYLGTGLIQRLYSTNEITVFSRNKAKQKKLKKAFPKISFISGKIENKKSLLKAMKGHTIAIFTASLKQVEVANEHPREAMENIVSGAINSREAAVENNLKAAVFISSTQSKMPSTSYGALKLVAANSFIYNADKVKTNLTSVVCGNIINSTGSIIPLICDSIQSKKTLTLNNKYMTRFLMDIDQVLETIEYAITKSGYSITPSLKSFSIFDLFKIYSEDFGLQWKFGKPKAGEKVHEQLLSIDELYRTEFDKKNKIYLTHYKNKSEKTQKIGLISSETTLLSKETLRKYLKSNNYFKK